MSSLSLLLRLSVLLNLAFAVFFQTPLKPSEDSFYDIPSNISSFKEGEMVKWRKTPTRIRAILAPVNIKDAWQFMVRSTNSQGAAIGIVGTIIQPYDADLSKVLTYSYFQDSAAVDCAPSYSILYRGDIDTLGVQIESVNMNVALTKGWNVLVVDYEGPNAAFTAGRLSGMATLDAIRATLNSTPRTGINPTAKVALWGYSGGTIPSAWAGVLQPSYAPELKPNMIGIAIGGTVANLTSALLKIDGTVPAGLVGAGVLGLVSEYPKVQEIIFGLMDPKHINRVTKLYKQCLLEEVLQFTNTGFFTGSSPVFLEGTAVLYRPDIREMLQENILGNNALDPVPEIPLFAYHGEPDELVPFEDTQRLYEQWCEQGISSFEFAVSQTSGHTIEYLEGAGAAIEWISRRFAGDVPVTGCSRTVRKSNLEYPNANSSYLAVVRTAIQVVFQQKLGPMVGSALPVGILRRKMYNIITTLIESLGAIPLKRDTV